MNMRECEMASSGVTGITNFDTKFQTGAWNFAHWEELAVASIEQQRNSWIQGRESLEELLEFHDAFESIHPFQDGNGRVGRLMLFKECLRNNIVPFIIGDELKTLYYRGLHEWKNEPGYLMDTCLTEQDQFKQIMDYFRIPYEKWDSI